MNQYTLQSKLGEGAFFRCLQSTEKRRWSLLCNEENENYEF